MLERIQRLIYKIHFRGYSAYLNRAPITFKSINQHIKKEDSLIDQFDLLRKTCKYFRINQNHNKYNELLKYYIPTWKPFFDSAKFMNVAGSSIDNLNIYRKIKYKDKNYIEKVYSTHIGLPALSASHWFYNNVYNLIKKEVQAGKVIKSYSSNLLTIIYYEYLDNIEELSVVDRTNTMIELSKALYKLSLEEKAIEKIKDAPSYLKYLHPQIRFMKHASISKVYLLKEGINLKKIEDIIQENRKVFTHGDLTPNNILANNILIDWDTFGLFPAGYEIATIYYDLVISNKLPYGLKALDWLKSNYESTILKDEWEIFKLSFIYYSFIFIYGRYGLIKLQDIQSELLESLKTNNLV